MEAVKAFASLPADLSVFACSAKQAGRLLNQPGTTAYLALATQTLNTNNHDTTEPSDKNSA